LPHKLARLRELAEAAGRDPAAIEVSEQCVVVLGRDEADFTRKWATAERTIGSVFDLEKTAFRGTPPRSRSPSSPRRSCPPSPARGRRSERGRSDRAISDRVIE
jgi:alkanesulfonate monooxygenase SsuD/methylene tetrahydromethanopterin reductase-like flavin-dependent oxidoreductase (luciferase family)